MPFYAYSAFGWKVCASGFRLNSASSSVRSLRSSFFYDSWWNRSHLLSFRAESSWDFRALFIARLWDFWRVKGLNDNCSNSLVSFCCFYSSLLARTFFLSVLSRSSNLMLAVCGFFCSRLSASSLAFEDICGWNW